MTDSELQARISNFSTWYYEFDLRGRKTPVRDRSTVIRHGERRRYFFDPLLKVHGGALTGRRVLDLGCSAGFFTLHALACGCASVLGIDQAQDNIERTRLVLEANDVDPCRYALRCDDFFNVPLEEFGPFDVVLALGILHWMDFTSHIKLLERVCRVGASYVLIDTVLAPGPNAALALMLSDQLGPLASPPHRLVALPTRRGLLAMMREHGYQGVILKPCFTDYTGSDDYVHGCRRAFLFSKAPIPEGLRLPVECPDADRDVSDLLEVSWRRLASALLRKGLRKVGLGGKGA